MANKARKIVQIFARVADGTLPPNFYGLASDGSLWVLVQTPDKHVTWNLLHDGKLP